MDRAKVLLIDDDRNFLRVLTQHIEDLGFDPHPFQSPASAVQALRAGGFDIVISDLRMPEFSGLDVLRAAQAVDPELPVIVLTAHGSIEKAVEATKEGAFDFLTKPFDREEMRHVLNNALKMASLSRENRNLKRAVSDRFKFEGIAGSAGKLHDTLRLASQLAEVDTTVLIQGESGTGKEMIAKAIHYNSARSLYPFIVVNCGAIPADLIESELFGHRKGSFTGAVTDKKGKFEAADKGTVFLDEVGELPVNAQVKLLRVLQEGEIDVVGDVRPVRVDTRILAATNRDLEELMGENLFREDLYYRLTVAPLRVPPLRERLEDIPLLAHHFLERYNRRFEKDVHLAPGALEVLQRYRWPGNVRELENIIHRSVVFSQSGTIETSDLPSSIRQPVRTIGKVRVELPENGISMEDLERDLLLAALEKNDWNQTRAAQYLGISRNTLIYRMQKFQLRNTPASRGGNEP